MTTATYYRLLRENGGDYQSALLHAAATIDYLSRNISPGYTRVDPKTRHVPKPLPEPLDVAKDDSPNG